MAEIIELNQGEVKVKFTKPVSGKNTLADLGLKDEDLVLKGGLLRLVFDLEGIGEHHYYKVPTIEVAYNEEMGETHWVAEFNGETILDKLDNHGRSSVLLLNRTKLAELEHHHENVLVIHAEFPGEATLVAKESYVTLFN